MKKIILSLMFLSFLIPGVGNIQADVRAKALDNSAGFYSDYLDDEGFVKYETYAPDTSYLDQDDFVSFSDGVYSPYAMDFSSNDYTIDSLITSGRIVNYVKPGGEASYPIENNLYNTITNLTTNHNYLYNEADDITISGSIKQHQYFIVSTISFNTTLSFKDSSSYISLRIYCPANFINSNYNGFGYLINYLNSILLNGEEVKLLIINDQPVIRLFKQDDNINIIYRSSYVYFDKSMQNIFIDLVNVGTINSLSYLVIENWSGRDPVHPNHLTTTTATFDSVYIDTPFYIMDYDHLKGILTLRKIYSSAYSGYDTLVSLKVDNIIVNDVELIDSYNEFSYSFHTYKISIDKDNKDVTTHDILLSDLVVSNGTTTKTIEDLIGTFRYLNQDVHHRLRVDANIDYWFNYSKVWFTITDLEAQCRILNNMAHIIFAYYELDKEWTKPNAEELIRVVYHNRFENLQIYFEAFAKEIFNKTYDELTYAEKYHLVSSITSNEEFIDKYGRTWNLKYVKGDAGNRIEQEWSGVTGGHHDWELYTSKPGNLVYWDPELLIIYVSYITEAGETIKTSAYKDGLYAEQIDGEWVIKDYQGNIYDNYSVNEDGLIFDENGDMIKSDTTDVNYDPFDSVVKWFEEAFSSKNILKLIGITFGILAVVGLGYILFIYTKHKVIANASKKKKRK